MSTKVIEADVNLRHWQSTVVSSVTYFPCSRVLQENQELVDNQDHLESLYVCYIHT